MKRPALAFALFIAFAAGTAHAETYYYSGVQCNASSNDINIHPYYGSYNTSTTNSQYVWCPTSGILTTTTGVTSVVATVYDRGSTDDIYCTLTVSDFNGSTIYQNTQHTSSWSAAAMTLSWTVSSTGGNYVTLKCSLPALDATHGFSHMASFKVVD